MKLPNNSMQRTALGAAAEAERSRTSSPFGSLRAPRLATLRAKPSGLGEANGSDGREAEKSAVDFRVLVRNLLAEKKDEEAASDPSKGGKRGGMKGAGTGNDKNKSLYDGPLVELTYEPKPKKERQGGKTQQPDTNAEQVDAQPA